MKADPGYAAGHLSLGRFYHGAAKYQDLKKALYHYRRYIELEDTNLAMVEQVTRTIASLRGYR